MIHVGAVAGKNTRSVTEPNMNTANKKTPYEHLKEKWLDRHKNLQEKLRAKHKESLEWVTKNLAPKQLAVGSLGSLLLLTSPGIPVLPSAHLLPATQEVSNTISKNAFVVTDLSHILPNEVRPLTSDEEEKVVQVLSRDFGFTLAAELEGKRLNRSYGFIGQEQHLARYPGDTIATHFDPPAGGDAQKYASEGMAPGLGAWGYFAQSKEQFTEKDKMRETYYIAVQTFLAPGFLDHVKEYGDFFKYRKMLVVNPNNGNAIVAVIGDAGPGESTGKHLGGSPEVMRHLERVDGSFKGPVLYFFIDDPHDTIPLGPVQLQ